MAKKEKSFIGATMKARKFIPKRLQIPDGPKYTWEDFGVNVANINYWRPFILEDESGESNLMTIVYFYGSGKGVVIGLNGEQFIKACSEAAHKEKKSN